MHSRIGCGHIDSSLKKQIELSFQLVFQHNALPETFLIYNFKVPAEIEKEGHPHCDGGRGGQRRWTTPRRKPATRLTLPDVVALRRTLFVVVIFQFS